MNTIVLITGKQGSGKTFVCSLMRNAVEIPKEDNFGLLTEKILKERYFKEIAVVTSQDNNIFFSKKLQNFAKAFNFKFQKIDL